MNRKITAALLSGLVCPGAGQLYNRQYVKGALLIAAVIALLSALVYRTWNGMLDAVLMAPPEEALKDVFGLAHRVLQADKQFYDTAVAAFLIVWAYGIIDAYAYARRKI